jgi:UDP-GlcNAc:undecaprenyl-phosphate/decaprenyl-phosphate GlcNAc-1-phosphate transferase
MWLYVLMFVLTLVQGCALTLCALQVGRRLRILDFPDKLRKLHERATPRTGGLAVCSALVLGVCEAGWLGSSGLLAEMPHVGGTVWLIVSAVLLCGLGLWDDKFGMSAGAKLAWQAAAVLPFVCWGRTATTANLFGWQLDFAGLAIPIALFWLVSCVNFVNLVDGLDGLAGSVGLIVSAAVAWLAWWHSQTEICLLASILAGALVGFLVFNKPPARIFLGDSGSLPLGFLVGALSLEASAKRAAGLTLAVPLVLLSIPMFDTSMAILRRKLNGRSIGQGDRAHIHHCLRDRGWSPSQTLFAISAMCFVTALAVVAATVLNNDLVALTVSGLLLVTLIAGRVFGFNETMLLMRHLRAIVLFLKSAPRMLRAKFVAVRLEGAPLAAHLDLWDKIVERAERLDARKVEFTCEHLPTGKELAGLRWSSESAGADEGPVWELNYAAPRGRSLQTRIQARGLAPHGSGIQWLSELAELFVSLCSHWPVSEADAVAAEPEEADDLPPQILTARWGKKVEVIDIPAVPHRIVGRDAA